MAPWVKTTKDLSLKQSRDECSYFTKKSKKVLKMLAMVKQIFENNVHFKH